LNEFPEGKLDLFEDLNGFHTKENNMPDPSYFIDPGFRIIGFKFVRLFLLFYLLFISLTATPGSHNVDIQHVLTNLRISHIEARDDEDADIAPFIHKKNIVTITVCLSQQIKEV
jgi:hypothetical protein